MRLQNEKEPLVCRFYFLKWPFIGSTVPLPFQRRHLHATPSVALASMPTLKRRPNRFSSSGSGRASARPSTTPRNNDVDPKRTANNINNDNNNSDSNQHETTTTTILGHWGVSRPDFCFHWHRFRVCLCVRVQRPTNGQVTGNGIDDVTAAAWGRGRRRAVGGAEWAPVTSPVTSQRRATSSQRRRRRQREQGPRVTY